MDTKVDSGLQRLACEYIRKQSLRLSKHLEGAWQGSDVEDIHQARVACRRMRAAMNLFGDCFDDELLEDWKKQTKKLLKSFGEARDLDVQIIFLEQQLKSITPEQKGLCPGINKILSCWREKRAAVQTQVIRAVRNVQRKHIFDEIKDRLENFLRELETEKKSMKSSAVCLRASQQIHQHVIVMLEKFPAIENPLDAAAHHQIRIAAKKLRYVMEICNEALKDKKLKKGIKSAKQLQALLGEMHDCDVWNTDIETFMQCERRHIVDTCGNARPFNFISKGLEYLKTGRHARRVELFGLSKELIREQVRKKSWEKLLRYMQLPPDDSQGDECAKTQNEQ